MLTRPSEYYRCDWGPEDGPLTSREGWFPIGVFNPVSGERAGEAIPVESLAGPGVPLATFRLLIGKSPLPGRYLLLCREFVPIEEWTDDRQTEDS